LYEIIETLTQKQKMKFEYYLILNYHSCCLSSDYPIPYNKNFQIACIFLRLDGLTLILCTKSQSLYGYVAQ